MFGENLVPSSCRHLLRWRCKLERRLALFMGADWPLQVSWLLEFRAFALGTDELVTKRLEFGPARLLIANGSGRVGIVLRSEERRVGKEGGGTGSYGWWRAR